jgi:hypothetical protein
MVRRSDVELDENGRRTHRYLPTRSDGHVAARFHARSLARHIPRLLSVNPVIEVHSTNRELSP